MAQFFAPRADRAPAVVGHAAATVSCPATRAHAALAAAPEARCLDDALAWMASALVEHGGFDRVMVLRSAADRLAITGVAFRGEHDLASEARHNAERHPVVLRTDSLEVEMMRRRAPALVVPADDPRAWHPIIDQLRTPAYVAAPVVAFGRTVATLHADAHFAGREVDAGDRTVIGMFATVFGGVAERALLFTEVERLRGGLRAEAEHLLTLAGPAPADDTVRVEHASPAALAPAHAALTARENEVLALMSRGATSKEIARRLVVSTGTVKTHARNILRKLGASNRAEAVARAAGPSGGLRTPR